MTTFQDGPAHGVKLMLRRSPYFLRVTYDSNQYDALDQLADVAKPEETIYLYRITAAPGWWHIRASKPEAGGRFSMGNYEYVKIQPPDDVLRHNDMWVKWVGDQTEDMKRWAEMLDAAHQRAIEHQIASDE